MFRRLGMPFGEFNGLNRFGGGNVRPGFNWNQFATFEAGAVIHDPTGFDAVAGAGSGDLAVNAAAALRGNFGLDVPVPNTNNRYGIFNEPDNETYVEVEGLASFEDLTFPSPDQFTFIMGFGGAGECFFVDYRNNAGTPRFVLTMRNNAGGATQLGKNYVGAITQSYNFRFRWQRDAANGYLIMYINGEWFNQITGIVNDTRDLDAIRLGAVVGLDATTSGNMYFDNWRWTNQRR